MKGMVMHRKFLSFAIISILVLLLSHIGLCKAFLLPEEMANLETEWLFSTDPYDTGKDKGWANPSFDDSGWRTLRVPGSWEAQGVTETRPDEQPKPRNGLVQYTDYDGVAWYRLHFIIPSSWAGKNLILQLGSVDDQDFTYLNGQLVGSTGPGLESPVTIHRRYKIPASYFRPGKENVLAIRVYDGGGPGGIMGPYVFLLPEDRIKPEGMLPQSDRPLKDRFKEPAADNRILKIIHSWPDDPDLQDSIIGSLMYQGFGGVVCNVSFDDYLHSEAKWDAFKRAVTESKKVGMSLWLYDEKGYPSGTAGNQVMTNNPEWEAEGLLAVDGIVENGEISLDVPPGKLVIADAYPVTSDGIDITKGIDLRSATQGGKMIWKSPEGRWHAIIVTEDRLYDHTFAAASFADRVPYINLLLPAPTQRFIDLTHKAYADHLGEDLGKYFVSTFTDEPSLMNRWVDYSPYRAVPWSPIFVGQYSDRWGSDIVSQIPLLFIGEGSASKHVRYRFWKLVGELVSENYFGQIQDFCKRHNILSGGHLVQEESIVDHVAFYGNYFQCVRRLDAPGIDCLTSMPGEVPHHIGRIVSSAADLENRTITMSETSDFVQTYRAPGDNRPAVNVSTDEIRGTCNRLMVSGINTITSYYTFNGLTNAQIKELNEWVGRCSTMLQGGHRVADIAVVYPIESIWPRFSPAHFGPTDSPAAMKVEQVFNSVTDTLYNSRREFSYIDTQAIIESRVLDGKLIHGDLSWRVIVLPCVDTLPMEAWQKLIEFQRSGGVLIAVAALPTNTDIAFPSQDVKAMALHMFNSSDDTRVTLKMQGGAGIYIPVGMETLLRSVINSIIEPDVRLSEEKSPIRISHRRIDDHDIFFVINDGGSPWMGDISIEANDDGEMLFPGNGQVKPIGKGNSIGLDLKPYDGVFLRFPSVKAPKIMIHGASSIGMPSLSPIDVGKPSIGSGEFVNSEKEPVPIESSDNIKRWKSTASLTKGQTDTYSMVAFPVNDPKQLAEYDLLAFDTWVPEEQQCNTRLLIILQERNGGEYIVDTGRLLNSSGFCRIIVPYDQFRLASWSKDPDGKLDVDAVERIVIGWGGYYGTEGERIEFDFSEPLGGKFPG